MSLTVVEPDVAVALDALEAAVGAFQGAGLDQLSAEEELALVGRLEVLRRRLDAGTDRAAEHLDRCAAFALDGHKSAKGALKAIGRLSGAEAHGRVQTARALREVPLVAAAYERGAIPTAHVRAIARVVANPRVAEHLPEADPVFAHHGSVLGYDDFLAVLRQWEALADVDGAAQAAEECKKRRRFHLTQSAINGSWSLEGSLGAADGAAMAEIFEHYERAELLADWADARKHHGDRARQEHLARTPAQRRADALFAIFRRVASTPADGRTPEPLVNIVIDQTTLEDQLRRTVGETVHVDPNQNLDQRRCHSIDGTQLPPTDVLVAAVVGHVRRVVLDGDGNVIDLGRKRRLFTGASRDAAMLQALLRGPGGLRCAWPGCDAHGACLQADHRDPAAAGGPTDIDNSEAFCGGHNRIKEHGFRPQRGPDGTWTIHRPDGQPITPPI